jgi:hypothetical protein
MQQTNGNNEKHYRSLQVIGSHQSWMHTVDTGKVSIAGHFLYPEQPEMKHWVNPHQSPHNAT